MPLASTETYVAWMAGLLLLGSALALVSGILLLSHSRRLPYFQLRRRTVVRGWQLVLAGVLFLGLSLLTIGLGRPAFELVMRPTLSPTASNTPAPAPTDTQLPSATLTPSITRPPTVTSTPTDSPAPTLSPTPPLPQSWITPILTATVTPPAGAVAANIRFSLRDNCAVINSIQFFDQVPKQIFAHFDYDNWLPGVQWSGVWMRDGETIYVETGLWDGSTGGCGFSNYDHDKFWWPEGSYEVQIFVGDRWLVSNQFVVLRFTPTGTATSTRTPRTPTLTPTPTASRTPRTPTVTPTRRPTAAPWPRIASGVWLWRTALLAALHPKPSVLRHQPQAIRHAAPPRSRRRRGHCSPAGRGWPLCSGPRSARIRARSGRA